jgi:hypothetical protein
MPPPPPPSAILQYPSLYIPSPFDFISVIVVVWPQPLRGCCWNPQALSQRHVLPDPVLLQQGRETMEWIKGAGLLLVHGRWERNCELRRQAHRSITDSQVEDGGFEICIGDEAAMDDELGRSMEGEEAARIFLKVKAPRIFWLDFLSLPSLFSIAQPPLLPTASTRWSAGGEQTRGAGEWRCR